MIRPELRNLLSPVRTAAVLVFALATAAAQAAPPPDPSLVQALDSIWQGQRPAVTRLSEDYTRDPSVDPPRYTVPVKDAPEYVALDAEHSEIELGKKRFVANESPWGPFPLINTDDAELLEINFARKRYVVISAIGAGLYGIGDWQRFGFLHVIDTSNRGAPVYYPLFAEAGMRDKVLGRLPNSAVLNYARLVPSRWANNTQVNGYEVLLYSLQPRGPERVIGDDARPLAYTLTRDDANAPWVLARTPATPIANVRDDANRAFSAPPMKNALPQTPASNSAGGTAVAAPAATDVSSGQAQAATEAANDPAAAKKKARKDKNDQRKKEVKDAASEIAKDAAKDAASEAASQAAKKAIPSIR